MQYKFGKKVICDVCNFEVKDDLATYIDRHRSIEEKELYDGGVKYWH